MTAATFAILLSANGTIDKVVFAVLGLAIGLLLWRWPAVRGTTLIGPWSWLLVSLVGIGIEHLVSSARDSRPDEHSLRLLLAALALCPGMSLLGAKRPQDKPWHFIVGALWLVLTLPGIQTMVLNRAEPLEIHSARAWFLLILWLSGVGNSLLSRFWASVLIAGLGQAILLAPFFPNPVRSLFEVDSRWGILSYCVAVIWAAVTGAWRSRTDLPIDRLWRDFRDAFGLAWTIRIAERIEANARSNGWNICASWRGIHSVDGREVDATLPSDQMRVFRQNLRNLLRRFVDDEWISKRLGE